jgi:hypothetical protein
MLGRIMRLPTAAAASVPKRTIPKWHGFLNPRELNPFIGFPCHFGIVLDAFQARRSTGGRFEDHL